MVRRNVPMYQAKIPIRGGGGRADLRERAGTNPIVQALQQIIQQKRLREQDELSKRLAETRIAQTEQPKQPPMKIVVGEGKTWLVNPATGEKRDLGIAPPRSKAGGRNVSDIINEISKISEAAGKIPTESLDQTVIDEAIASLRGPLMGELGLEEYEEEAPSTKKTWGWPTLTKPAYRVRPERTETRRGIRKRKRVEAKERPPKPKGYPDAKWSEEHQMWTIVKNERLMGVK